jgi:HEAT repeat protein
MTVPWLLPDLIQEIEHGVPETRALAIVALPRTGDAALKAVPQLRSVLQDDPDETVRLEAALALARLGQGDRALLDRLVLEFRDRRREVRLRIRAALVAAGGAAVPSLIEGLSHPVARVRWSSAMALGKMGEAALPALPKLKRMLREEGAPTALNAQAWAFEKLSPPKSKWR